MKSTCETQLVCFDLGGVVVRICRTFGEGCRAAGLDERGNIDAILALDDYRDLDRAYQRGQIAAADHFAKLSALVDGIYTAAELARVHEHWMVGCYPGVTELARELCANGVPTAVLSNTSAEHWVQIRKLPVIGHVDRLFASHVIGAVKPDDEAYEHVERSTGVRGGSILFFDDLTANIRAASERGWDAVQIDHAGDTASQMREALVARNTLRQGPAPINRSS